MDENISENCINMQNLCCSCLSNSNLTYPLTNFIEISEENHTIKSLIENITYNQVIDNENYPKTLCEDCLSLLKLSYQFKIQYESSSKILNELLGLEATKQQNVSVELILGTNKYNLNDIVIVEDLESSVTSYEGFLRNLGTEISATFVNKKPHSKIVETNQEDVAVVIEQVTNTKQQQLSCESCGKLFINKLKLKQHIKTAHKKIVKHICPICGHISPTISSKRYHELKHQTKTGFNCNICGTDKSFSTRSNLKVHLEAHKNERKFVCSVCGKGFNYKVALSYHLRIHTGERKYVCDFCGMDFTMPCALKRHLRVHTKLRPYPCNYCEKRFKSKGEVNLHEMLHTGYRPLHCEYCGRGFTKSYNLETHYLAHRGPHHCIVCPRSFVDVKYLKIHLMKVHNLFVDLGEA